MAAAHDEQHHKGKDAEKQPQKFPPQQQQQQQQQYPHQEYPGSETDSFVLDDGLNIPAPDVRRPKKR
jgi:hypothetical protein